MKRRNDKKTNTTTLKIAKLLYMLKCVHLGGVIEEVVAVFNGKKCSIGAVDITNSLCVITSAKITKEKMDEKEIGFGNIDTLIKFLSTSRDLEMKLSEKKDNILLFSSINGKRSMKYISTVPSMIPTVMDEDNSEEEFLEMQSYKIALTRTIMQDFKSYISLCKTNSTEVKLKNKELSIIIGSDIEDQFTIAFESNVEVLNKNGGENFSVMINGNYLEKIFSVIEFNDENPPCIYVTDSEKPVFIQAKNTWWGILPVEEEMPTESED